MNEVIDEQKVVKFNKEMFIRTSTSQMLQLNTVIN